MAVNAVQELDAVGGILASWQRARDAGTKSPASQLLPVLDRYEPEQSERLRETLARATHGEVNIFVRGPAVIEKSPVLHPIVKVHAAVTSNILHVGLRLFMFFHEGGRNRASGWRFDTAEISTGGKPALHPYPHAQVIMSFDGPAGQLLSDLNPGLEVVSINESRPAFPLRGSTSVGLTAAMVAALHGAPGALEIVRDVGRNQLRGYREELQDVLGTAPFPNG